MSSIPDGIIIMTIIIISSLTDAHPRSKDYRSGGEVVATRNGGLGEPSCEELKAMWRFSKRQSRASEITNEIPMYRDPFANNVWEPYYTSSRSIGGQKYNKYRNTPIYGRVIHNPPYLRPIKTEKHKAFEEFARLYGMAPQEPRRKIAALRMTGDTAVHNPVSSLSFSPQQGSFQHLKELIKTERSRELQRQRASEEAAARAAALKDLANEKLRNRNSYFDHYDYDGNYDIIAPSLRNHKHSNLITYPNMLHTSSARPIGQAVRFIPDYSSSRSFNRFRNQRPIMYDSFNSGYSPYLP